MHPHATNAKKGTCAVFVLPFLTWKTGWRIIIPSTSALWADIVFGKSKIAIHREFRMQLKKEKENKQPYEKPKVRIIELKAEEVLAIGCKTSYGDPRGVSGNGCLTGVCSSTTGS